MAGWAHVEDIVGHHCGLFGIYNAPDAAARAFLGLFALQHRGQESAGIAVSDGKQVRFKKAMGLVSEVIQTSDIQDLPGHIAIAHVRYSTTGASRSANIQPLVIEYSRGPIAVAHNGNLVNARTLHDEYEAYGSIFQTTTDSEIVVHLLARPEHSSRADGIAQSLRQLKGAFSFLFMTRNSLIGARDPQGFRPLVLGRIVAPGQLGTIGEGHVLASETCALDMVGAEFVREIEPGEIVTINSSGVHSSRFVPKVDIRPAHCLFEHVYFARPDSTIFGDNVHQVRVRLGEQLAREYPVEADVVISVPDSGRSAALGYSRQSGIPYDMGFIRSHYVGRSFIKPQQIERERVVGLKFNVIKPVVQGKRVVVVEDSLIRGTTFRRMARLLRAAGVKEIHLRITCPPTKHPCYYGIDFPDRDQLVAARLDLEGIRTYIGVDTLGYLSIKGLLSSVSLPITHYCTACWSGSYPVPPVDKMDKMGMEGGGSGEVKERDSKRIC